MSLSIALFILAQTTTPTVTPVLEVDVPICMSRPVTDVKGKQVTLQIVVTPDLSDELLKSGFTAAPCAASRWNAARYREEMCRLAEGNSAVQARWAEILGVEPKRLCEATASLGSALDRVLPASAN